MRPAVKQTARHACNQAKAFVPAEQRPKGVMWLAPGMHLPLGAAPLLDRTLQTTRVFSLNTINMATIVDGI
jgi:hypothetical protein